jgi:hypothetical protein
MLEVGRGTISPEMMFMMARAFRRLRVLKDFTRSYWDLSTQNQKGGKLKWRGFLGSPNAVQALLNAINSLGVNTEQELPLHWAAYFGFHELVKELLDQKKGIEDRNHANETALLLAAQNGQIEVLKVLQKSSANLGVVDYQGRTFLHHAALNGRLEVLN